MQVVKIAAFLESKISKPSLPHKALDYGFLESPRLSSVTCRSANGPPGAVENADTDGIYVLAFPSSLLDAR